MILNEWGLKLKHHGGLPAVAKFFLPSIVLKSTKTILLDLDIIVGSDISLLWSEFNNFASDTVLAFPSLRGRPYDKFCSCVGLLHLERMLGFGWKLENATARPRPFIPAVLKSVNLGTADQTLFNSMWYFHSRNNPAFYQVLSNSWNLHSCRDNHYGVFPGVEGKVGDELFFGIVHYNCGLHKLWNSTLKFYQNFNLKWTKQANYNTLL